MSFYGIALLMAVVISSFAVASIGHLTALSGTSELLSYRAYSLVGIKTGMLASGGAGYSQLSNSIDGIATVILNGTVAAVDAAGMYCVALRQSPAGH